MAGRGKTVAVDEKRTRSSFRMRTTMNFDPKMTILHGQEEVIDYLEVPWSPLVSKWSGAFLGRIIRFLSLR